MKIINEHVPFKGVDTPLDFVNFVRSTWGVEPVKELVKGTPGNAEADTIVMSIKSGAFNLDPLAFRDMVSVYCWDTNTSRLYFTPKKIAKFMRQFDRGDLPHLVRD